MRERPILFSGPMVRAILDGRKTQTRRIVTGDQTRLVVMRGTVFWEGYGDGGTGSRDRIVRCPYGAPGDRLWVRETHAQFSVGNRTGFAPQCVAYRATCDADGSFDYVNNGDEIMRLKVTKWTPAIHMPRWASRITLEVTGVRVERLQAISEEDARAEGVDLSDPLVATCWGAIERFSFLWDGINGTRAPWSSNPWVWVVEFRRVEAAAPALEVA